MDLSTLLTTVGAVATTIITAIWAAMRQANASMPKRVADELCHEEDEHDVGHLRAMLRTELAPLRRGQRRLARQVKTLNAKTDAMLADADIAEQHRQELSERLAELEESDDAAPDQSTVQRRGVGAKPSQAPRDDAAP